ncbi:hypothetical protein QTP86_000499 [Hemibagrus guttatus]|nr:hypothetical protein QTP86_000499 [Hemibagrus guttatus]
MLYGLETVSLRKRQESELEVAELKMLREFFLAKVTSVMLAIDSRFAHHEHACAHDSCWPGAKRLCRPYNEAGKVVSRD